MLLLVCNSDQEKRWLSQDPASTSGMGFHSFRLRECSRTMRRRRSGSLSAVGDGNPACPHCGSVNVQTGAKHPSQPYRCREKGCRKFFSVKTGTAMAGSNLGYQVWAIASYLLATGLKGQASMKLHRDLGISQKAAWFLAHRLRETWETQQALFAGPVEVDETYMGGKEKKQASGQEGETSGGVR